MMKLGFSFFPIHSNVSTFLPAKVYQARLRSNGQVVAVKVQRPGVQAAISLDILLLRYLVVVIRKTGKFNTDLQAVVDEWASSLFREMDYKREASNGAKFRQLYGNIKDVVVPEIYMNQTTQKVLIMEWIEGQKLVEVKNLYLVEVGVYCSFNQLLENGFYHADPHPGNLLATYDGKLAYLDFGMMGEFRQDLRDGFIEACLHLVNRDYDALAKDFVTLGYQCHFSFFVTDLAVIVVDVMFVFYIISSSIRYPVVNEIVIIVHNVLQCYFNRLLPPTSDKEPVSEALTGTNFERSMLFLHVEDKKLNH
ncbi:hypothetical protein LIER_43097 [Lithospermum erythrorhizon]|uniref:ABC1 atypical kinase-like domain-containing protein n=1 Tax=Lithospermum erythrorhizon TaxID=34254 RepID=A0AAV3PGJ1_LITER